MSGILSGGGGFLEQLRTGTAIDRAATIAEVFALASPDYGLTGNVLSGCLSLLQDGKLSLDELAPHLSVIVEVWSSTYSVVARFQEDCTSTQWMYDEDYTGFRYDAEVALDLFGYLP